MVTINSVSGGKTSAYLAAHFPADYNIFALVRIEDSRCRFPDEKVRRLVEDKLQAPFVGTAEDDKIIYTMLDLEQFLGREIIWVTGSTFDEVVRSKGGWLPNKLHRYCTTHLKIEPQFYWWAQNIGEPVEMRIGFRANETKRMFGMTEKLNENGLLEFKATFEKNSRGQNKWETTGWQKPAFPLITNRPTFKDEIVQFWMDKQVRFAELNNCVGCFHRNPLLLNKQFSCHPNKMNWFLEQEKMRMERDRCATWRSDTSYEKIKNFVPQLEIEYSEFGDCDSGFCGL